MCASSESSGDTLQVYLGWWTRPDTYICSTSARKDELNAVWVLDFEWGRGKFVLGEQR